MENSTKNDRVESLLTGAKLYLGIGYSVIPVYGDTQPESAKVAAHSWKTYQHHRPTEAQIDQWFAEDGYLGLAIITGRISNLVVIDFDSPEIERLFKNQFPYLLNTRIVKSANRGLSHYYYHIPSYVSLKTRHIQGADLLSNGCYVLAPPTSIDGKKYEIEQGGMPYSLSMREAKQIEEFFTDYQQHHNQSRFQTLIQNSLIEETTETAFSSEKPTLENLIHLYQAYAQHIGRNNALFKVACYARDHGYTQAEIEEVLKQVHSRQKIAKKHHRETLKTRLQEAENTIASVFTRPPQKTKRIQSAGLTTSIREALLKLGLTHVARVLDCLFVKGFKAGGIVTEKIIARTLSGIIGRHSILASLKALFNDHTPIFTPVQNPPPQTPSHISIARYKQKESNKKCFLFSKTKSDKNDRGRPATHYVIPEIDVLCAKLGVRYTDSDPIKIEDLQGAKAYRQAVHRELIKRRPGMYARAWLAERLGISRRTSQRYDMAIGINRKPMYVETLITWGSLNLIPADEAIDGTLLEDARGKRYPARRDIAAKLLKNHAYVWHLSQDWNYYSYGDSQQPIYLKNPRQEEVDTGRERTRLFQQYWNDLYNKKHIKPAYSASALPPQTLSDLEKEVLQDVKIEIAKKIYKWRPQAKRYYRQTLPDSRQEYWAQKLYETIWERAEGENSRLSKENARRAIDQYGVNLVTRVLQVLCQRKNIHNPAGFVVTWLRSTAKEMLV